MVYIKHTFLSLPLCEFCKKEKRGNKKRGWKGFPRRLCITASLNSKENSCRGSKRKKTELLGIHKNGSWEGKRLWGRGLKSAFRKSFETI